MRAHVLVVLFASVSLALVSGCSETPPDRLALDPSGPFHFDKKGQGEDLKVAAFAGTQPVPKKVPVTWKSSDTSVATVDDAGHVAATGSGSATVTASAWGLEAKADVSVRIVGGLTVDEVKKPLHLSGKGVQLHVVVKDDKGKVIEKPELVRYHTTNYCVEVDDEGFVKPLSEGDCEVVVEVANQSAKVKLSVVD